MTLLSPLPSEHVSGHRQTVATAAPAPSGRSRQAATFRPGPAANTQIGGWQAVGLLVVGGILLGFLGAGFNPVASARGLFANQGVTFTQYESLRTGMTYEDAARVLGNAGSESSRSDIADIVTVVYQWDGSGSPGANVLATFQDAGRGLRLVTKTQTGLR